MIRIVHCASTGQITEQGFAGDVANSRARRHEQAQAIAGAIEHLEPGKAHHDHVAGLHIAQREGEEVFAFGLNQRRPPTRGFLFAVDLFGRLPVLHLRPDDPAVNMQLAAIDRGSSRQGKGVGASQWPVGVLMMNLIEFDAGYGVAQTEGPIVADIAFRDDLAGLRAGGGDVVLLALGVDAVGKLFEGK